MIIKLTQTMEVFDAHDLLDDTGASLLATSFQEG